MKPEPRTQNPEHFTPIQLAIQLRFKFTLVANGPKNRAQLGQKATYCITGWAYITKRNTTRNTTRNNIVAVNLSAQHFHHPQLTRPTPPLPLPSLVRGINALTCKCYLFYKLSPATIWHHVRFGSFCGQSFLYNSIRNTPLLHPPPPPTLHPLSCNHGQMFNN